ncbi:MAG: glycine cleavage system protein GcvH [Oscillospiraceae bacterium]|jgi:glycine cleavage system H protein|nr:glycine cleavage system protein GcvH [Oscillospiraceae bacterium]
MTIQNDLLYSKSHEWIRFTGDNTAQIGLTDFAQDSLGSLVFINLPEEGDALSAGESFGDVESVKAVSDIISPVSGTVAAINTELLDAPEKINEDPYGTWLIEAGDITDKDDLLSAAEYEAFCSEEG